MARGTTFPGTWTCIWSRTTAAHAPPHTWVHIFLALSHGHSRECRIWLAHPGQAEWVCNSPLSRLHGNAYPTPECLPTEWLTYCVKEANVVLLLAYLVYDYAVDLQLLFGEGGEGKLCGTVSTRGASLLCNIARRVQLLGVRSIVFACLPLHCRVPLGWSSLSVQVPVPCQSQERVRAAGVPVSAGAAGAGVAREPRDRGGAVTHHVHRREPAVRERRWYVACQCLPSTLEVARLRFAPCAVAALPAP